MSQGIQNAVIRSTMLGVEDHGIFTFNLDLDYGGSCQGFGGWTLDAPKKVAGEFVGRFGTAEGMQLIAAVLKAVGVESWEKLPGTHVRADASLDGVRGIGHILKDTWIYPEKFFASAEAK